MDRVIYLDRFQVVSDRVGSPVVLRRGRGSVTYKAQDRESGREVSLEVMSTIELEPAEVVEMEGEAKAARGLQHLNIPGLLAFGHEADRLVYASEYFDGTPAEAWVKSHGPMPVTAVLRIALQIGSALEAAAFHEIVHPAINPRDILLVPGQTAEGAWPLVKLLGLVGPLPVFGDKDGPEEFATPFASPEELQTGAVDFRSEMYSLGATLWFLLTGDAPIAGEPRPGVNGVPKSTLALLDRMLDADPEARPHDPLAFQESVRQGLDAVERRVDVGRQAELATVAPTEGLIYEPRRGGGRKWVVLAAALVLLAAMALFGRQALRKVDRLVWGEDAVPLGVPVGVPESSPTLATPQPTNTIAPAEVTAVETPTPPAVVESVPTPEAAPAEIVGSRPTATQGELVAVTPPEESPTPEPEVAVAAIEPQAPPVLEPESTPEPQPTAPPATATPVYAARTPAALRRVPDTAENARDQTAPAHARENTPPPVAVKREVRRALPVTDQDLEPVPRPAAAPRKRPRHINGLEVRPAERVYDAPLAPDQ
ncbi:MAG: serine/threonine protein kinase [Chthoniobacterales bacterium]